MASRNDENRFLLKVDVMLTLRSHRRGLTLVELMVSIALTLMVVFALVRVFALLGDNVTDGRATIEMSGSLRSAAQLLREDLEGLTVTTLPPRSPDQNEGYFEYGDGPSTDSQHFVQPASDPARMVSLADQSLGIVDADNDGYLDTDLYDTSVGDVDDVLAFTTRRIQNPFTGTISDGRIKLTRGPFLIPQAVAPTLILESPEAEVVWWLQVERNVATGFSLLRTIDGSEQLANATSAVGSLGVGDEAARILTSQRYPNFTSATLGTPVRSLHRRVLLIRPDLDLSNIVLNGLDELAEFLTNNDISVRVIRQSNSPVFRIEANSLGDLSKRHHRAYRSVRFTEDNHARHSPRTTRISDQRTGELLDANSYLLRHAAMKDMIVPHAYADGPNSSVMMLRKGKDVVLSDVLAFDVQIWDPQAVVRVIDDGTAVSPHDPSYVPATLLNSPGTRGAYVDLGFAVLPKSQANLPSQLQGLFGGMPHPKSLLANASRVATYCTWSSHYEHDGYDQDGNDLVDQGHDGIDNDNQFGVDDPGEAETSPPYPHPMRGLKVSMRIMDSSTRQVRQTSVVTDFLPE